MSFAEEQVAIFKKSLLEASRILIVSHKNPDGDTLGSALGLYCLLRDIGKSADLLCASSIPEYLKFRPYSDRIVTSANHIRPALNLILPVHYLNLHL